MKTVLLAAAVSKTLSASQETSPAFRSRLEQADHVEKVKLAKEPRVQLQGNLFAYDADLVIAQTDSGQVLGLSIFSFADLFASAQSPAFWLSMQGQDTLVLNPHIFGEASVGASFTLKLLIWNVTLKAEFQGIKFSPLDFQIAWDLNELHRYCYSVGYFMDVLDFSVEIEAEAYECQTGVVGWATNTDPSDCFWRKYRPHLPLLSSSLLDSADLVHDYQQWTCSDDSQLETLEKYDPKTGEIVIHPQGWEPSNIDNGGDFTEPDAGVLDEGQDGIEEGWDLEGTTIWEGDDEEVIE